MKSEDQIKRRNIIVAGVTIGAVILGGAAYLGLPTASKEQQQEKSSEERQQEKSSEERQQEKSSEERQQEKSDIAAARQGVGGINRSIMAFYVEEGRFPQNFLELTNKYRGFSSNFVSGYILERIENSNMKFRGYEFNMRLVDSDTVHVSAVPLYRGDYPTISGGVFMIAYQATGKLCQSQKFTNGSIEFPERDTSGGLTCPSGYDVPKPR